MGRQKVYLALGPDLCTGMTFANVNVPRNSDLAKIESAQVTVGVATFMNFVSSSSDPAD